MRQRLLLGGLVSAVMVIAATGCCCIDGGSCGPRSRGPSASCGSAGCGNCGAGVGGCGIVSRVRNSLTCGGGCGDLYVGDWHNYPPGQDPCDDCGNDCGGGCGDAACRRPLLTVLRRLWGVRYCGGCETGCSDCGYGGCDHGVEAGHGIMGHSVARPGCASCADGHPIDSGQVIPHAMPALEGEIIEPKLAPMHDEPKAKSNGENSSAYYSRKRAPTKAAPTSHRTTTKPRRSRIVPRSPA